MKNQFARINGMVNGIVLLVATISIQFESVFHWKVNETMNYSPKIGVLMSPTVRVASSWFHRVLAKFFTQNQSGGNTVRFFTTITCCRPTPLPDFRSPAPQNLPMVAAIVFTTFWKEKQIFFTVEWRFEKCFYRIFFLPTEIYQRLLYQSLKSKYDFSIKFNRSHRSVNNFLLN